MRYVGQIMGHDVGRPQAEPPIFVEGTVGLADKAVGADE